MIKNLLALSSGAMLLTGSGERNVNCRDIVCACVVKTGDVTGGGGGGVSDCSESRNGSGAWDDDDNERCEASAAWTPKSERTRR